MTGTRRALGGLLVTLALCASTPALAQTIYVPETTERNFRVEFQVVQKRKGPEVEGYVYNRGHQAAQRVLLQIQRVDASGAVVGSSNMWLPGEVPMESRAYFSAAVTDAASYRVQVLSYDWACQGGGGGM
jgi:hypothetical protein